MSRLKPCPFCGEELIVLQGKKYYAHDLKKNEPVKCYAGTWVFRVDDEERIRLWNTRKPMGDVLKLINNECQEYFEASMVHEERGIKNTADELYEKYKVLERLYGEVRKVIK